MTEDVSMLSLKKFEETHGDQIQTLSYHLIKKKFEIFFQIIQSTQSNEILLKMLGLYSQLRGKLTEDPLDFGLKFKRDKDLLEINDTFQNLVIQNFTAFNMSTETPMLIMTFYVTYSEMKSVFNCNLDWIPILIDIIVNPEKKYPANLAMHANLFLTNIFNHPNFDEERMLYQFNLSLINEFFGIQIDTILVLIEVSPMHIVTYVMPLQAIVGKIRSIEFVLAMKKIMHRLNEIPTNYSHNLWATIDTLSMIDLDLRNEFIAFLEPISQSGDQMAPYANTLLTKYQEHSSSREMNQQMITTTGRGTKNESSTISHLLQKCPKCLELQSILIRVCTNCENDLEHCLICKSGFNQTEQIISCKHCSNVFHKKHLYAYVQSKGQCAVCKEGLTLGDI